MHLLTPDLAAELARSVRAEVVRLRAKRASYAIGLAVIAVGFALVAFFKLEREIKDLPLLFLAGALHSLGYVGLYLLLWPLVIAKLIYESTLDQLVERWFRREAVRRPEKSFGISAFAYWRFVLAAASLTAIVFISLAAPVIAVFIVLPLQFDALAEILYAMAPSD